MFTPRQIVFHADADTRANLTEFQAILGFHKWGRGERTSNITIPLPSQAFFRSNGSLTIQARMGGNTVTGLRPKQFNWVGIKGDGATEPIAF